MPRHRFFVLLASGLASLATIACSSATQSSKSSRCSMTAADSALVAAGVYTECLVDQRAAAIKTDVRLDPTFSSHFPRAESCLYAELQFVIDTEGRPMPGTTRVLRTNFQGLADAVIASVPSWQYRPAKLDGQPVRQLVKERKVIATAVRVVVVRSGSPPPAMPPSGPPPNCQ